LDWGSDALGLLEGCEETFAAFFEEYDGADAGLRKFVGEGCELSRANNTALCWWDWRRQSFTGARDEMSRCRFPQPVFLMPWI
jgi:hypothetical protein